MPSTQTQIVVLEVVCVVVVVGALVGQEFGQDVREWLHDQKVLAPLRKRLNRKAQDVGPWQKKLAAMLRLGEAERIRRRH